LTTLSQTITTALDETPFFFGGTPALFGVLHRPPDQKPRHAFVLCHPFGEEKLWTHRVFVSFARQLAADGHAVLRFDQRANGDSEGLFAETTLETAAADVETAIHEVRERTDIAEVTLVGLRLGATIAGVVADRNASVARLISWEPIVDGGRYTQELLRLNVLTQTATFREVRHDRTELVAMLRQGRTVNVDGYDMGVGMYESVSTLNTASQSHSFAGPCLIVQISPQRKPARELEQLASSYSRATLEFAEEEPFWKEIPRFYQTAANLFAVTDQWLKGSHPDRARAKDLIGDAPGV
jgi:exosortase A-associated hydrolase 2